MLYSDILSQKKKIRKRKKIYQVQRKRDQVLTRMELKRQVSYFYFLTVVQIRTQNLKIIALAFLLFPFQFLKLKCVCVFMCGELQFFSFTLSSLGPHHSALK